MHTAEHRRRRAGAVAQRRLTLAFRRNSNSCPTAAAALDLHYGSLQLAVRMLRRMKMQSWSNSVLACNEEQPHIRWICS